MVPTGWHLAHVIALALWGGVVLTESVIEIAGLRHREARRAVARLHYHIDILVEAPLIFAVILTGVVLLLNVPVVDDMLWLKIACGLGAAALNLGCVVAVIGRKRRCTADADTMPMTRWVFRTAGLGIPLAMIALYLGGVRGGWW